MLAITSAQYEAIGRLAIATNDIDELLEALLEHFLSTQIPAIASVCLKETRFVGDKRKLLGRIIRELEKSFPAVQPYSAPVNLTLQEIDKLLDDRNKFIHGKVKIGQNRIVSIESPDAVTDTTPEQITGLAAKAKSLSDNLILQCSDILMAVGLL